MRFFYDTVFIEDGRTIDLISIGIVTEGGREYYAVNRKAPWRRIKRHPWLIQHVMPGLPHGHGDWKNHMPRRWPIDFNDQRVLLPEVIAGEVRDFLLDNDFTGTELWAWYGAYDHVLLAQMFGPMAGLPDGIPMWTNDLQQEFVRRGISDDQLPQQDRTGTHNALADARHVRDLHDWLGRLWHT